MKHPLPNHRLATLPSRAPSKNARCNSQACRQPGHSRFAAGSRRSAHATALLPAFGPQYRWTLRTAQRGFPARRAVARCEPGTSDIARQPAAGAFHPRTVPQRPCPRATFHDAWKVVGMNRALRLFKFLLERKARVFQPTLIDAIDGAVRPNAPGHRGNCVNDEPHTLFDSIRCSVSIVLVGFNPDLAHRALLQMVREEHIGRSRKWGHGETIPLAVRITKI